MYSWSLLWSLHLLNMCMCLLKTTKMPKSCRMQAEATVFAPILGSTHWLKPCVAAVWHPFDRLEVAIELKLQLGL